MTVTARIALMLSLGLVLLAGLATFLPASPQGATCGTWVSPEWTKDDSAALVEDFEDLAAQGQSLDSSLGAESAANAQGVAMAYRVCSDALSTRRTTSLVLLVLAVVLPAGVMFVGRGRRAEA